MRFLRQSTSADVPLGPFVDAADGVTPETTLTLTQPDIRLKKNAAAWAQKAAAQTLSHEENGFYEVTLDATDTDTLGLLRVAVLESGAAPVWEDFMVITAQEFDRLFTSTGQRQMGLVATGTAQAATATSLQLAAAETFADDVPNGMTLVVHGSTQGYSQVRQVTDYVSSTDTATVDAWTVTPSGTITYWLFATPPAVASGTLPGVDVVNWKGATAPAMTGDAFARLGAPAGASVSADLLVIDNLIDDLESRLTAARAGYLDNLSAGAVAQASTLATVAGYLDTEIAAILAIANKLDTALELDGAVYRFTLNALELAPTGGSAPTAAAIRAEIDSNSTQLAAIKAKTDALPTDPADQSIIIAATDAILSAVGDVPTNAELATALAAADDAVLAAVAALPTAAQNAAAVLTTAMTESYSTASGTKTLAQALYEIFGLLGDFEVSGTTLTVKNLAGTGAATFTLNDATAPTSVTRAT
jgi:hypothetical protein